MSRSYTREQAIAAFWSKVDVQGPDDCWLWKGSLCGKGYGKLAWEGSTVLAHRLAFFLCGGYLPGALQICHSCDVPSCCNPCHLFAGTGTENMQDAAKKGRTLKGTKNPSAKLTEDEVLSIRSKYKNGLGLSELSREYGVDYRNIWLVVTKKTWQHLD